MAPKSYLAKAALKVSGLILLGAFCLVVENCGKPPGLPASGVVNATGSPSAMTFGQVSAQIIRPKCLKCHSYAPYDFSSYDSMMAAGVVTAGDPQDSMLYTEVATADMPKGGPPLSPDEVQMISQWITDGAKESVVEEQPSPSPSPSPTTQAPSLEPTYTALSTQIFLPKCVVCHGGADPAGGYDFSTYDGVSHAITAGNASKSKLYKAVSSGKMPMDGTPLSADELSAIQTWITNGAQNN